MGFNDEVRLVTRHHLSEISAHGRLRLGMKMDFRLLEQQYRSSTDHCCLHHDRQRLANTITDVNQISRAAGAFNKDLNRISWSFTQSFDRQVLKQSCLVTESAKLTT